MLGRYRFEAEAHQVFRNTLRKYLQNEAVPYYESWEEQGTIPKQFWRGLGEMGFLCSQVSEDFGGLGLDFSFSVIVLEELERVGTNLAGISLHNAIVVPYIDAYGSVEQKERWLPGCTSADFITGIALSESDTSYDFDTIQTTAIRDRDSYIVNGQKVVLSNGLNGNLFVIVVKTDPYVESEYRGISLILVEEGTPGFTKMRNPDKSGLHARDTALLTFDNCRVPTANLLGEEGQGFRYLKERIQQVRLAVAIGAQTAAEEMLENIIVNVRSSQSIPSRQETQLKLAEMATQVELGKAFLESLIEDHMTGKDIVTKSSMAKYWLTEMAQSIYKECMSLYEGCGYVEDCKTMRSVQSIPFTSIYTGSNEDMKMVIAESIGL